MKRTIELKLGTNEYLFSDDNAHTTSILLGAELKNKQRANSSYGKDGGMVLSNIL